jgi:hypothetical protein
LGLKWRLPPNLVSKTEINFPVPLLGKGNNGKWGGLSSAIFPTCGKAVPAHCWHGGVHAKTAWPIPAPKAREIELSRLRAQNGYFFVIASSNGNGRAKRHIENSGIFVETSQMQRDGRVRRFRPNQQVAIAEMKMLVPVADS